MEGCPGLCRAWILALQAINAGLAVPGFSTSLAYFDTYRRESLPANLVQVTSLPDCIATQMSSVRPCGTSAGMYI